MISEFETLTEYLGADYSALFMGLIVGLMFGILAQQSRFCLRSAVIEFWRKQKGRMVPVWLLAFSSALLLTQVLMFCEFIDKTKISYLNVAGSLSGALIGGALFGVGMILARGCASRLLILSATGNLRAFISWVIIALVADQTIRGFLASPRSLITSLYSVPPSLRDMSLHLPNFIGVIVGFLLLGLAIYLAIRAHVGAWSFIAAVGVGFSVVLGWVLTGLHAAVSFDIISIQSLSFIGPSVDSLKTLVGFSSFKPNFSSGLVFGVFFGSFVGALFSREFSLSFFNKESGILRYLVGACLMGFGGVLAVGCSVGAGLTGVSVLSLTALASLITMIVFAGITDRFMARY